MSVPASVIGTALPTVNATVERGRLQFFAEAIGETDPRYSRLDAATAAGFPDLPVPPTFLFGLKLDGAGSFEWMADLGIDLRFILHGTQQFVYHRMAFAGDQLELRQRIADVYEKKGGALEFLVVETEVTRDGEPVATMTETIVVQHPEKAAVA